MWPVGGRLDLGVEIGGFDIAYNADNLIPKFFPVELDTPSQRVFVRPESTSHRFIDDDHSGVIFDDLTLCEISAHPHRNAHRSEEVAVDHADIGSGSGRYLRFGNALKRNGRNECGHGQPSVEWQHTDDAGGLHAGESLYSFDRLLEKRRPFRSILIRGRG